MGNNMSAQFNKNLLMIFALLLIQIHRVENHFNDQPSHEIELEVPEHLEQEVKKFSDIIEIDSSLSDEDVIEELQLEIEKQLKKQSTKKSNNKKDTTCELCEGAIKTKNAKKAFSSELMMHKL